MRDLLAWTWCAGAMAAAARSGLSLLAFGFPLSILGYRAIARSDAWRWPGWSGIARRFWPAAVCVCIIIALLARQVRPLDAAGGMALAGGVAWSVALAIDRRRFWRVLAPAPIVAFVYLSACTIWPQRMERFVRGVPGSVLLQDVRGGRNGVRLLGDFCYSWPGPNTALIERFLGPLEAEWEGQWYLSRGYSGLEERVNRRSILRQPDLAELLALLPDDVARRQALMCATTPNNLARVHQGLLLASLKRFGYPAGYDAERWWRRHAAVFRVVENPNEASRMVFGWRQAIRELALADGARSPFSLDDALWRQLDAAYHQEMGMWGGDDDFSDAYFLAGLPPQDSPDAEQAPHSSSTDARNENVAWWELPSPRQ